MFSSRAEWEEYQNPFAYSRLDPCNGSKKVLPLAGIRVLALDDHDDTNRLFSTVLELEGALVKVFNTALPALEVLEQFQPELLICDLAMPGMDGDQFIVEVRARGWRMPAIAISGRCEQDCIAQALALGFNLYMRKPVHIKELITNVIQLLVPQDLDTFGR
ncbi:MAG: response regulator [Anaerolineae bacterium]|nr:response regulator [Gloeobacterales cyanobacterium ES-bin-313]